jgi:hypothetical protein
VAFSEVDLKRIDATIGALCRSRSPAEYADQLRFVCEIDGNSVSMLEQRPPWDGGPGGWTSHGVARFRYFRSRGEWQLYWMRRDLKWHIYEPAMPTKDLARLVKLVEDDEYCAFFG